jgi:YidC/Oxa1 family membrane protein insertase
MTNEKRFVLFIAVMFGWLLAFPYVMRFLGLSAPPRKPPTIPPAAAKTGPEPPGKPAVEAEVARKEGSEPAAGDSKEPRKPAQEATAAKAPAQPNVEVVEESELVLGSLADVSDPGYRLLARLQQNGAGLESLLSSRFDAEFEVGLPRRRPLQLVGRSRFAGVPSSLSLTISPVLDAATNPQAEPGNAENPSAKVSESEDWMDSVLWEVVRDVEGRIRRPIKVLDPATHAEVEGQSIAFRIKTSSGVVVTKTFKLGKNIDGLEVELTFESPDRERQVVYNLLGPHGIPIEGEWYTGTFRDVVFGQLNQGTIDPVTYAAYDVAKATDKPIDNMALPLRFGGVENQYFATIVGPDPAPKGQDDRWDSRALALVLHKNEENPQKSDVAVRITSRPVKVAPNQPVVHAYRIFAGPKIADSLRPYDAEVLATYRKNQWIPFAPYLARAVITPTLAVTYEATARIARLFGASKGNYGIAIILLTILVRGLMFPLGRKQALIAQKMQELQPHLKEIQEKYKEDKERLTKETFALYKKHGVNPAGGCLPALIQLPIFVGLWQALNTSVALRHAPFLWIRDLAAPDMMFRFPFEVPFLGVWFNLLPFLVIGLMLLQTKLFSPPATSPDAEMQQKMMKYMMIFMGVMFYKVPSGLGIYFITSSLWAIGERLLLPKVIHAHPQDALATTDADGEQDRGPARGGGKGGPNPNGPGPRGFGKGPAGKNGGPGQAKLPGKFAQFWERILEEASKDPTYRKAAEERERKERDREKGSPRARPRRR